MEKLFIIVDGVKIYHGDKISAEILYCDEHFKIDDARLCINNLNKDAGDNLAYLYICQDECDGDASADDKFEYRYSWNFKVNKHNKVCSDDTIWIKSKEKDPEIEDDDPMPEDWICEEKFPIDL